MTSTSITVDSTEPESDHRAAWQSWHLERERALAVPHGWLSLTGFFWVPERGSLPGIPGTFRVPVAGGPVEYTAAESDEVSDLLADRVVDGSVTADVPEGGSALWLEHRNVVWELIRRTGRAAFRVRDPRAAARAAFVGVPVFDHSTEWIVPGVYVGFDAPRTVTVGTALPGFEQQHRVIGTITLTTPGTGVPVELLATAAGEADNGSTGLSVLFHDAGNGTVSALWRSVGVAAPTETGAVVVDFNRAVNQPFSFSDFGTCPRPPAGNVIDTLVAAGERTPAGRSAVAGVEDPTVR